MIIVGINERCAEESTHHLRQDINWYLPPGEPTPDLTCATTDLSAMMHIKRIHAPQKPMLPEIQDLGISGLGKHSKYSLQG
jgi:hypothetical protein